MPGDWMGDRSDGGCGGSSGGDAVCFGAVGECVVGCAIRGESWVLKDSMLAVRFAPKGPKE